jgi:tetratricopeptide (TPR) repeat protein
LSGAGLPGAIVGFISWAIMVKYSYEALRHTSEGRFSPPSLSSRVLGENFGIVFKQIGLFIALFLIFGLLIAPMHPFFWVVFGLCVLIGLPAMIIILAINDDLGQALNPVYFMGMAVRIGWGYLLLFFFLFLLFSAPGALGYAVIQHLPESLHLFFWQSAKNYYTLVSYHLMGYVILQYHDRLGHQVDMDTLLASTFPAGPARNAEHETASAADSALLDEIARSIQEGDLDGAIALIEQRTHLEIRNLEVSERYLQLLKMCRRPQAYMDYAPRHLDLLVMAGEKARGMAFYQECITSGDLKASPAALFKIGSWFNEKGEAQTAVQALNTLVKNHPQDALIPKTCYRAAQILHEKLMNTEKAKKLLTALIAKYPDHEISGFARSYLDRI